MFRGEKLSAILGNKNFWSIQNKLDFVELVSGMQERACNFVLLPSSIRQLEIKANLNFKKIKNYLNLHYFVLWM